MDTLKIVFEKNCTLHFVEHLNPLPLELLYTTPAAYRTVTNVVIGYWQYFLAEIVLR